MIKSVHSLILLCALGMMYLHQWYIYISRMSSRW